MPEVIVYAVAGRSQDQKRGLVKDITAACVKHLGAPSAAVVVQIVECDPGSKSKGGILFSEMTEADKARILPKG